MLCAFERGAREVLAIGGNRSGKTTLGARWLVAGTLSDPADAVSWACCESSKVQRETTQPAIRAALADYEVRRDRHGRRMIHQTSAGRWDRVATRGGVIQLRNYEDGSMSATGAKIRRAWLDEAVGTRGDDLAYYKETRRGCIDFGGRILLTLTAVRGMTPLLRHLLEDRCDDPSVAIVHGNTRENEANLPPGEIESFERTLDDWERAVRIEGRVLPLGGRPYVPGALLAKMSATTPLRVE